MIKHEIKYCPRCNRPFECKVGTILLCQCTLVQLNETERDYMKALFDDCLCAKCMKEVRGEFYNEKLKNDINKLLGDF